MRAYGAPSVAGLGLLLSAAVVGGLGALLSAAFRGAIEGIQGQLTTYEAMGPWARLALPTVGGLVAGAVLELGQAWGRAQATCDVVEAVALSDGTLRARPVLVRTLSSWVSIGSGASVGREGPLIALCAYVGSRVGRGLGLLGPRRRLLVACGLAAGVASSYRAPIAGALFAAEVALGALSLHSFGPLFVAAMVATLTSRIWIVAQPLYEVAVPALSSAWDVLPMAALGLISGLFGPAVLAAVRTSQQLWAKVLTRLSLRLAAGGLALGCLGLWLPQVAGNGYDQVVHMLHHDLGAGLLLCLVAGKLVATCMSIGSGAIGGILTPTLMMGAATGLTFARVVAWGWPMAQSVPQAYALVGMGSLLAATTHAPLMAILLIFEMTLDYDVVLPMMLASTIAFSIAACIDGRSIYNERLLRRLAALPSTSVVAWTVADIMQVPAVAAEQARGPGGEAPPQVLAQAALLEAAARFVDFGGRWLQVVEVPGGPAVGSLCRDVLVATLGVGRRDHGAP